MIGIGIKFEKDTIVAKDASGPLTHGYQFSQTMTAVRTKEDGIGL